MLKALRKRRLRRYWLEMSMYNDNGRPEQLKAKRIIDKALSLNLMVSVADGDGGWAVKRSTDRDAIIDAVGEMDMDELVFRDAEGERVGWMMLVWGNDPSGSELVADYTDNEMMNLLAKA